MKRLEEHLQKQCVSWFRIQYPMQRMLLHMNYQNHAQKYMRILLSKLGWVGGVADLEYNFDGKTYFFELKAGKGKQTETQKKFERIITKHGFEYYVVRSLDEFMQIIRRINK